MTQPALKLVPNPRSRIGPEQLATLIDEDFRVPVYHPVPGDPVLYPSCLVPNCLAIRKSGRMCKWHTWFLWKQTGKRINAVTDVELQAFVTSPEVSEGPKGRPPSYSFEGMHEVVANELRYYVQESQRNGRIRVNYERFRSLCERIIEAGIQSVFDQSPLSPREIVMTRPFGEKIQLPAWYKGEKQRDSVSIAHIMGMVAPHYCQISLFDRDVWYPSEFNVSMSAQLFRKNALRFYTLQVPWVKSWTKKCIEYSVRVGSLEWMTHISTLKLVQHFDAFVAQKKIPDLQSLTRDDLLNFIEWLRGTGFKTKSGQLGSTSQRNTIIKVQNLLDLHRDLEWKPNLKPSVKIRAGEGARRSAPLPKPIEPVILNQLTSEHFLKQLDQQHRTALLILRYHGLRASSLVTLKTDCIRFGEGGAVLCYYNAKLKRHAEQPIMQQVVLDAIHAQQQDVLRRFPDGNEWLFPANYQNVDGTRCWNETTAATTLNNNIKRIGVKNTQGQPVTWVAMGEFRDTVATEMLNRGISPTIVAAWLDHRNTASLDHYARMQTEVMRRELENSPQITLDGRDVRSVDSTGAMHDVEMMRSLVQQATSTVAGGVCTLPARETCDHHNACYTCNHFASSPKNLPEHLLHLQKAEMLCVSHEHQGQTRRAEKDRQTAGQLKKLVEVQLKWLDEHPEDREQLNMKDWFLAHEAELRAVVRTNGKREA